jgi:hypothetical protein
MTAILEGALLPEKLGWERILDKIMFYLFYLARG